MSLIYSITLHTLTFDNNGWQMIDIYYCLICYQGWLLGSKVYLPVFSENIEQELLIFLQGQCLKADNYSFILDKRSSYYLCLNSFLNWFYFRSRQCPLGEILLSVTWVRYQLYRLVYVQTGSAWPHWELLREDIYKIWNTTNKVKFR